MIERDELPIGESEPVGGSVAELRERAELLAARRAARARTLQLTEWLGFGCMILGVEVLFGVAWALIALGVALVVIANAS